MNIFVGNLGMATEDQLRAMFTPYGVVTSAKVMMDFKTRQSQGYGFVEMEDRRHGETAVNRMNNSYHNGVLLEVNEARPRSSTPNNRNFSFRNKVYGAAPGTADAADSAPKEG